MVWFAFVWSEVPSTLFGPLCWRYFYCTLRSNTFSSQITGSSLHSQIQKTLLKLVPSKVANIHQIRSCLCTSLRCQDSGVMCLHRVTSICNHQRQLVSGVSLPRSTATATQHSHIYRRCSQLMMIGWSESHSALIPTWLQLIPAVLPPTGSRKSLSLSSAPTRGRRCAAARRCST